MEEIKIAMYGPSFGHNIVPFLDLFQQERKIRLLYIYRGKSDFPEKYNRITFFKYAPRLSRIYSLRKILNSNYQLIWFHRGYNPLTLLVFLFVRRKGTVFNINVWGEAIPRLLLKTNIKSRIFKIGFKRVDYIQANWYGTYNLLRKTTLRNIVMLPWGLEDKFYEKLPENLKLHTFTSGFIKEIPEGKYRFFYSKTIGYPSRHDLVIQAVKELVSDGVEDFIVFFWLGNNTNMALFEKYKSLIEKYNLHPYFRIVEHPFLPFEDYRTIYEKMDCGLQIAAQDQFSTTLTEAFAFKKEIIATRIEPYIILEEKFGLNLDLVELNVQEIANRMKKQIGGYITDPEEMKLRYDKLKEHFNFKTNIEAAIKFYIGQSAFSDNESQH